MQIFTPLVATFERSEVARDRISTFLKKNSHFRARIFVFVNGQLLAMNRMYQDIAKMAGRSVSILYL